MLLSSSSGKMTPISRQASVCQLAEKQKKKANRSKRCKSLLMLSSPFSASSSSVKSSLLSLWNPTGNNSNNSQPHQSSPSAEHQNDHDDPDHHPAKCLPSSASDDGGQPDPANSRSPATPSGAHTQATSKCVKMKLFEQPLEKLFSPKAMKQLNQTINSLDSAITGSDFAHHHHHHHFLGKRKRVCSTSAACLRKFTAANLPDYSTPATNTTTTPATSNNKHDSNNNINNKQTINITKAERHKLLLACLPQPIRNLLNELYLRGPSTIGIFRKSPNAKHCKELRQKLETDSHSSIEQFQVTVIASVFKEWLRSLPDCLLMSRLYPQWIDVAKLMEPLYQHQLQQQQSQSLDDSGCSDTSTIRSNSMANTSPRPCDSGAELPSPLTDNAAPSPAGTANSQATNGQLQQLPLDRARSCSTMITSTNSAEFHSVNRISRCDSGLLTSDRDRDGEAIFGGQRQQQQPISMSAFALSERHSECLRIVCQLLEALNEANLILLRSFICVLWHIANNSQLNKMSANNLGVCVGQSLLNDEHQSSSSASSSSYSSSLATYNGKSGSAYNATPTFTKRHRRSRSQCLLSSTLSLTSATLLQSGCYLDSSGAQETAKYVPMLVAFMIENAPTLFGGDVGEMFQQNAGPPQQPAATSGCCTQQHANCDGGLKNEMVTASPTDSISSSSTTTTTTTMDKENLQSPDSFDHIDSGANSSLDDSSPPSERNVAINPLRQQILVESSRFKSPTNERSSPSSAGNNLSAIISINQQQQQAGDRTQGDGDDDSSTTTTSILIVNPPKSRQPSAAGEQEAAAAEAADQACERRQQQLLESVKRDQKQQQRPLSATESTSSSSRASSSTSGVHSESPAFSNEMDSHQMRTTTTSCSNSPAPSSVSSPSSVSVSASASPVQERQDGDDDDAERQDHDRQAVSGHQTIYHHHRHHHHHDHLSSLDSAISRSPRPRQLTSSADSQMSSINQLNSIPPSLGGIGGHQQPQDNHMLHRYSTFMGVLNRVPKIPVQITTSNYGGEAVIYNPKPRPAASQFEPPQATITKMNRPNQSIDRPDGPGDDMPSAANQPVISLMKPMNLMSHQAPTQAAQQQQQQYHTMATISQQELRQQRINEFLAHRSQPNPLVSAPSLPYLHSYATAPAPTPTPQQRQRQPMLVRQQQAAAAPSYLDRSGVSVENYAPAAAQTIQQANHHHHHHQLQNPIFYSATNLNSLHQQQQDRYLLYHRASLNPQRSHVMSLRNYYLSLQQQNQQQQQQHSPRHPHPHHNPNSTAAYRNSIHCLQPADRMMAQQQALISNNDKNNNNNNNNNKLNQSSHEQHPPQGFVAQQQRQFVVAAAANQQPFRHQIQQQQQQQASVALGTGANASNLMTHHQAVQRPQPRLAKIRQNQFNGLYAKNVAPACAMMAANRSSLINLGQAQNPHQPQQGHTKLKPVSSTSSDDHSSDDSDEYSNDWAESTMV